MLLHVVSFGLCLSYAAGQGLEFTEQGQEELIQLHNDLRSTIPATNMQELLWDDELADLALTWAEQCDANHRPLSERLNYGGYEYVGENIAWGSSNSIPDLSLITNAWWAERGSYTFGTFPNTCAAGETCGHFTQSAWAKTCAVGCAAALCPTIRNGGDVPSGFVIVCNYGPGGNVVGEEPWKPGERATECPQGLLDEPTLCYTDYCPVPASTTPAPVTSTLPPTLAPLEITEECANKHQLCDFWAKRGDCYKNKWWMWENCRGSCTKIKYPGKCNVTAVYPASNCTDVDLYAMSCMEWAQQGKCESNKQYMEWRCRESCGFCRQVNLITTPVPSTMGYGQQPTQGYAQQTQHHMRMTGGYGQQPTMKYARQSTNYGNPPMNTGYGGKVNTGYAAFLVR